MMLYDLLEYSENYSMSSGSLQNYYRDEVNNYVTENENDCRVNKKKTTTSKPFE